MTMLPAAVIAGVLAAIDRLATVIERENAAFAAGRREPIEGLLDGKRAACPSGPCSRALPIMSAWTKPRAARCGRPSSG